MLLTTMHQDRANVMTMSWHPMLEFEPPPAGCGNTAGRRVDKLKAIG